MSEKKQIYKSMEQIDHILVRSDMYLGSLKSKSSLEFVFEESKIVKKNIEISPALSRLFVEILSNAIDNFTRSKDSSSKMTYIKINFDGHRKISIENDGLVIPVEKNGDTEEYVHSLIFGKLLSGSNYDDDLDRFCSGRNGLGAKLTNVFSTCFEIEGNDPKNKKHFIQKWTNNMKTTSGPVISNSVIKKGYTKVTWEIDASRFGIDQYSLDNISLFRRFAVDSAVVCGPSIKIYVNDVLIETNSIARYATLFTNEESILEKQYIQTKTCQVFLTNSSSGTFEQISFVNGIHTRNGGSHVECWVEALFRPIVEKYNSRIGKNATCKINISDVKQFFRLFVISTVNRPEFDGQEKNKLESPAIIPEVKSSHISGILKWNAISKLDDLISAKEMVVLKKSTKKSVHTVIPGYDSANNAGGKFSSKCTLIICEGLSAKTYAVAGIGFGIPSSDDSFSQQKGRDFYGILPLTGKILNVRNSTLLVTAANKVVSNVVQALGLKYGTDYSIVENRNSLNYGRIMIMTDADVDGIHIEGLLLNFFIHLFPTLLTGEQSFIVSMKTPIARVVLKKKEHLLFYDENNFNSWLKGGKEENYSLKYYKGLGTTKIEDVPDTFGKKMVEFEVDSLTNESMNKAFLSSESNSRKNWLGNYDVFAKSDQSLDDAGQFVKMSVSYFVDNEMIKFSHADCARSISSILDGLKESQRKILFCVKKRNLKYSSTSLKVAQLSGYTAEKSNYHHGEQNLQETIVGMAQDFVGSNNIPLLYRDGQFGSRLDGGHDAASPRYIFTKMDKYTDKIFRSEDEAILDYVVDDGDVVQPIFYAPIIPMILINGCVGIGTGWSSNIPNFNPVDVVNEVKSWIMSKHSIELKPWYNNFKGTIEFLSDSKWICTGKIDFVKKDWVITELPIGTWTNSYKEFLESLLSTKKIKSFKNYSTPSTVHFVVSPTTDFDVNVNAMKLSSTISTSNMVLFDKKGIIKRYSSTTQIIDEFCSERLLIYEKRKQKQLKDLNLELKITTNKKNFVKAVIQKDVLIFYESEQTIFKSLEDMNFIKDEDLTFDSLLRMNLKSFSKEKIIQLENEIHQQKKQIRYLEEKNVRDIWIEEIDSIFA